MFGKRQLVTSATGPPDTATIPLAATARPCGKRGDTPCSVADWASSPAFANNSESWELVNGSSGSGALMILVVEVRLL